MGFRSIALRDFGRRCDFFQPHDPADVALFVNRFPILIRLRGFKLDGLIADTALRQPQFVKKSQECWHCAASECEMVGPHATEAEGHGKMF
jgi:hypothetical protein